MRKRTCSVSVEFTAGLCTPNSLTMQRGLEIYLTKWQFNSKYLYWVLWIFHIYHNKSFKMHLRYLNCVSATFTYSTYINNDTFELTCSTICCCRLPLLLQSLRFFRPHLLHFITTETYFIERRQDLAIS